MRTPNVWVCSTKVRFKSCGRATPLRAVNAKLAKLAAVLFRKGDPIRAYFPAQVRLISYGQSSRLGTTQGFSEGRYRNGGGRGGKGSHRGSAAKRGHLITRRMGIPLCLGPRSGLQSGSTIHRGGRRHSSNHRALVKNRASRKNVSFEAVPLLKTLPTMLTSRHALDTVLFDIHLGTSGALLE